MHYTYLFIYYMYLLHVRIPCMYYMYVLHVCVTCMYYMYVQWCSESCSGNHNISKITFSVPTIVCIDFVSPCFSRECAGLCALHIRIFWILISGTNFRNSVVDFLCFRYKQRTYHTKKMNMVKMRVANYNFLDSYCWNKLSEQRSSKFGHVN